LLEINPANGSFAYIAGDQPLKMIKTKRTNVISIYPEW